MGLGVGTTAGATDIAGQRAVLPCGGIQKERVIVPGPGRRDCFRCRRSGTYWLLSSFQADKSKITVQDFTSPWFIVSGQSLVEFSLVSSS
jgi:hypothetical protein